MNMLLLARTPGRYSQRSLEANGADFSHIQRGAC
jgi:hypothetical protein